MNTNLTSTQRWKIAGGVLLIGVVVLVVNSKLLVSSMVLWRAQREAGMCSLQKARELVASLQETEAQTGRRSGEQQFLLGRLTRRIGEVDAALRHLKAAEFLGYDAEQIRQQRQLILFQRGHVEQTPELSRLLRRDLPDEQAYEVYEALAKGYLFSFRFKDAMQLLDFWIDWRTDATDPRIWRAGIYVQSENWAKAVDEYRAVLQIDPLHLEARLALGRMLMQHFNESEEAHAELLKCLEIAPNDPAVLIGLAACKRQLANTTDAEKLLRQVLDSGVPTELRTSAQLELGQVLLESRRVDEGTKLLRQVVAAIPHDSSAHYALGTALAASGDSHAAQIEYEKSRELVDQYARLAEITASLINKPDDPELRWEAGNIFMKQGQHTQGAAWMATALMYAPEHRKTHQSLMEYYEQIRKDERLAEQHRSKLKAESAP